MGYLKLVDAGAHSAGLNNSHQIVSARPEFVLLNPLEFVFSGGTAASPQVQNALAGLISAGTELWLKPTGGTGLIPVTVGGVSESGGGGFGGAFGTGATEKAANLALSNGNLTVTKTAAGGYTNVRQPDSNGKSSGKYYVEIALTTVAGHGYFGMVPTGVDVSGSMYPGVAAGKGWGYSVGDGILYSDGATVGAFGTVAQGNTLGIAVDLTNKKFWVRTNAGWLNSGDPAAGTNGWNLPTASSWVFDVCPYTNADVVTINVGGSSFVNTPPAGFASPVTCTLTSLSPVQASLPEKAYKIRSDKTKALMSLAAGASGQSFVDADFSTAVAIATITYAAGPELTVTGAEQAMADVSTLKRLALKLRSDITVGPQRARAAKIYIKERTT